MNNLPQDRKVRKLNRRPVFAATWIAVAFLTATVIAGAPATNADSRGPNEPKELSIFFIGNSYTAAAGGQQHLVIPTSYDFGDSKQRKTKKFSVSEPDARFLQQLVWKTYLASRQTMNERRFRN